MTLNICQFTCLHPFSYILFRIRHFQELYWDLFCVSSRESQHQNINFPECFLTSKHINNLYQLFNLCNNNKENWEEAIEVGVKISIKISSISEIGLKLNYSGAIMQ